MSTQLASLAEGAMAILALAGGGWALFRLIYRRGGDERQWTRAIDENTAAVKDLAISFRDFKDTTVATLHAQSLDHERLSARVAVVEEKIKGL